MDIEEIENEWKQEIKKADSYFLNNKSNKYIDSEYTSKINEINKRYSSMVSKYLKKTKPGKKKKEKREEYKEFKVKNESNDLSLIQKLKFSLDLRTFKIKFFLTNFMKKNTPSWISYNYLKFKLKIKRTLLDFERWIQVKTQLTENKVKSIKESIQNLIKRLEEKIPKRKDSNKDANSSQNK